MRMADKIQGMLASLPVNSRKIQRSLMADMTMRFLSYPIKKRMPVYGKANKNLEITPVKSLDKGDSYNVFKVNIENHFGTHVDCPAHFFKNGLRVNDYPAETWFFQSPFVLHLELRENQLVMPEDLSNNIPVGIDLLLIKSGFYRFRGSKKYSNYNPGFAEETGKWLRATYPSVRAIGFDFISLSSYQNREEGRKAHHAFLNPKGINIPILIIEDMDLSGDLSGLSSVWILPLRIDRLDSSPCTVVGEFEQ